MARIRNSDPALRRRRILTGLALAAFLAVFAAFTVFIGVPMLRFVGEPESFRAWLDARGLLGHLFFIGMVAMQVIVAVIPGEPLEIVAGYAFGFWEGTLLCLIGMVLGSATVFLFIRKWGVKAMEVFFSREKINHLQFIRNSRKLNALVFALFLLPGTPKDILTYFVGLTPMSIKTYLWLTALARIPSLVSSTIGGNALGTSNYKMAIIVLSITTALSITGALAYKWYAERKRRKTGLNRQ